MSSYFLLAAVVETDPVKDQWQILLGATLGLIAVFVALNRLTRVGTIARATFKEAVRQPIFLLVAILGTAVVGINHWIPFFSMGDDTKIFVDCGLYTILVSGILLAVWTASQSVAEEIEGRTAMTLLSKPIHRWQFVVGKYLGIVQSILLLTLVMGVFFFGFTYSKYGYDQRESGKGTVNLFEEAESGLLPFRTQQERLDAAVKTLPALATAFMEACVMAAVSVAISTRLPMLINIVSCFAIFVIGRLTPVLVESKLKDLPVVKFMANIIAVILPSLDSYNMTTAISTDRQIPNEYLLHCSLYSLAYIGAAMMLALILFEDRDLA
jgi:ABC-type transport system involved in multi-copper enzyme maturation permease subunit